MSLSFLTSCGLAVLSAFIHLTILHSRVRLILVQYEQFALTLGMKVISNVFKTKLVTKPEKLPVHDSLVRPMVELWSNM